MKYAGAEFDRWLYSNVCVISIEVQWQNVSMSYG